MREVWCVDLKGMREGNLEKGDDEFRGDGPWRYIKDDGFENW
jgi:hypothetical protein